MAETHEPDAESTEVALVDRPPHLGPPVGRHPLVPLPQARNLADTPMAGLGQHAFDEHQRALLIGAVDPAMIDILPSGEVYLPQIQYRRLLNIAFGPGAWGLLPIGDPMKQQDTLIQKFGLVVHGATVAVAFGEQALTHGRMTWATAWESAKSNALMRCAKDLGIASECWDKRFIEGFKAAHCVQVKVAANKGGQDKIEIQWRRADAAPLRNERGVYTPGGKIGAIARPERTDQPRTALPPTDDLFGDPSPRPDDEAPPPPEEDDLLTAQLRASLRQRGEDPDAPPPPPPDLVMLTDKDRRRLLAQCREHGVSVEQLRAALARHGVQHLNEIPTGPCLPGCIHKAKTPGCNDLLSQVSAWVARGGK